MRGRSYENLATGNSLRTAASDRPKVLVVDDDEALLALMRIRLQNADAHVFWATSGPEALRLTFDHRPDVVLLDVCMPHMDGLTVCQRLRELSNMPIIMVTALEGADVISNAFAMGADDYITKPFDSVELFARVQNCLRRASKPSASDNSVVLGQGELIIDLRRHSVSVKQQEVHLTRTEFDLLVHLARNQGRVLTHARLKEAIWGEGSVVDSDRLKQLISALRRKIEPDPRHPQWLLNEHSVGYILTIQADDRPEQSEEQQLSAL